MRKKVIICDNCRTDVSSETGGWMRVNPYDSRRTSKYADLCGECIEKLPGAPAARRGRKPTK